MKFIAWDTETFAIQPGLLAPRIVCHSFADEGIPGALITRNGDRIADLLTGNCVLVGANVAYDFGCLLAERPELFPLVWKAYEEGRVWDVLTAATLVAISQGRLHDGALFDVKNQKMKDDKGRITSRYSLYNTTLEWTGRDTAKANDRFRLSYALLAHLPTEMWPPDAQQYPKDDAQNTLDVGAAQRDSGFDFCDLKVQVQAAFCAHLAAINGMRTDPERVRSLKGELVAKYLELHNWAVEQKLLKLKTKTKPENGYSKDMAALKARVTVAYNGNPPTTEKGGISTARETYEESNDPILERFSEISAVEKQMSYLPTLEEASVQPMNTRCNILLSTGRASYDGMIQLMPRKGGIRNCFKARGTYISVDYSAVEMATLAQVCLWSVGESKLAEAINSGQDPHCIIASNMDGSTYEDFYKQYKEGSAVHKDLRQAGKAGDFGYPGMMGAPKFTIAQRRAGFSVCEWLHRDGACGSQKVSNWHGRDWQGGQLCLRCIEVSAQIKKAYLTTWTEVPKYWNWIKGKLEFGDIIEQFVSRRLRGGVTEPQAANSYFQGLAADGAKRALVKLTQEMYLDTKSPLYGSRLCVFAHDETIIDVPEWADVHDAGFRQRDIMVEEMQKVCPDVKISALPAAMKYWYKEADTVYNDAGRLVPWEPKIAA